MTICMQDPSKEKVMVSEEERKVKAVFVGVKGKPIKVWDNEQGFVGKVIPNG